MNGIEQTGIEVPPKLRQVLQSRKVWAGVIGLVTTLALWRLGEIDGPRAIEAMGWVLGIFIGSVALEDGMTRLFGTLAHAVATHDAADNTQSPISMPESTIALEIEAEETPKGEADR